MAPGLEEGLVDRGQDCSELGGRGLDDARSSPMPRPCAAGGTVPGVVGQSRPASER